MPFLAPLFGAIGAAITAVGSFIAPLTGAIGGLGVFGKALLGIGLNLAMSAIQGALAKKNQTTPPSGVDLDLQFGEGVSRKVMCGRFAVAGHFNYANAFGAANKTLQQEFVLSDFPITSLDKVWIDGEEATLGEVDATRGAVVTSGDYANRIWIKLVDGWQDAADAGLISGSNPTGRWTEDHLGLGMAYVIVTMDYDREKLTQPPQFLFECKGAPLYDWRKDTSIGGSGDHRWNDTTTWEFTENPMLMAYAYHRGISINGDLFCGMEVPAGDMPLDRWTLAANICDETADYGKRYRCSIGLDCNADHGDNIEAILTACGGIIVNGVGEIYVIIGTDQDVVATLTDDDLIVGEPVRFQRRRSMDELVNSVAGTFPDPDNQWGPTGYVTARDSGTVTTDRRSRDVAMNFGTVPYPSQAAQLAAIYLSENRFEATATLSVRPRWQMLEPGDWIIWNSARYGARTYMVVDMQIMSDSSDGPRNAVLSLQERSGDIYDGVGVVVPVIPLGPATPTYASELQDFAVLPISAIGADGRARPAIRASWSAPTDPTVSGFILQWRIRSQPDDVFDRIINVGQTVAIIADGVMSSTLYEVRHKLITDPARVTSFSAWKEVTTSDVGLSLLDFGDDVLERFNDIETDLDTTAADLAQEVTDRAAAVAAEAVARAAAVAAEAAARADAIAAEASARETAITAEADDRASQARVQSADIRRNIDDLLDLATEVVDLGAGAELERAAIRREIKTSSDTVTASFVEAITIATGPDSAIVQAQTTLEAAIEDEASTREASIDSLQTAYTSADEALASEQTALAAAIADEVSDREASIDTVNAAYAAADTVVALQTATLATQIRGSYEGSDYALAGGMIAQLNSSVTSQFESVSTALASISAGVGEQFDFSTIWNFDTTIQGWTGNGTPTWVSGGGWMRPANHATDPYVVSPSGLEVDLDTYPQVRMRIRKTGSPTWEGYLWWKLAGDGSWDAGRRVTMDEPTFEGGIALVSQDLGATGELDQIRIDLSDAQDGTDYFEIDWVAVGRPSPGASVASLDTINQALSNAINSEASSREALSTKIFGVTDPSGLDLGDLSSGLLYSERTARSAADTAILESITVLEGAVGDVESDLSATGLAVDALDVRVTANEGDISTTASALSSLSGTVDSVSSGLSATGSAVSALDIRVTANEDEIESVSSSLDALGVTVAGKADASALEDIETNINISNLEGLTAHSRSLRELEAVILADALETADLGAGAQLADQQAAAATATVREEVYSRTLQNEADISAVAGRTTTIEAALPGLASAVYVDTVEARVTETEGGLESAVDAITTLSAALDENEADTAANADAITATNTTVSHLADAVSANASDITVLTTTVGTKASASALTALTSRVTDTEDATTANADDISALTIAVGSKASASAVSTLAGRVTDTENATTANADDISALEASLADKASASALSALSAAVSTNEDGITSVASRTNALEATVNDETTGVAATASALSSTNSTVSDLNGVVTSLAEDVTAVETKADNATAGGLAKWTASSGSGDVSVSFEQLFRASLEGEDIEAGEVAEIYTEGGVLKARKILRYDKVLFAKADGTPVAVFGDDSGDLVIQNIRVGTVKFDQLSSNNGKLVLKGSGSDASIEVFS